MAKSISDYNGIGANVMVKHFKPENIPALILETENSKAEEKLHQTLNDPKTNGTIVAAWKDVLDEYPKEQRQFILNASNDIVDILASLAIEKTDDELCNDAIRSLYHSAWIYANRKIKGITPNVNTSVLGIIKKALLLHERNKNKVETIKNITKNGDQLDFGEMPTHIRLFLITPFSGYDNVEKAVRSIFEAEPFFFEVKRADEYTHSNSLKVNVINHIAGSHGFIAEISDLNPNVMLEVGAIIMRDDNRPIFSLRSNDAKDGVPTDINNELYIPYTSPSDSINNIKTAILKAIILNNRIKHKDIERLIKIRQSHFLSRTVCENLGRIKLSDEEINNLMGKYSTIERLLQAKSSTLSVEVGIEEEFAEIIQKYLRKVIQA